MIRLFVSYAYPIAYLFTEKLLLNIEEALLKMKTNTKLLSQSPFISYLFGENTHLLFFLQEDTFDIS